MNPTTTPKSNCQLTPAEALARREAFYQNLRKEFSAHYKTMDPQSTEVCFNLAQTFILAEAMLIDRAQPTGLTLPGINILTILHQHKDNGCPLNSLSHLLVVSRANITGLMDSLVRRGLVTREEHPDDRRIVLARITKKGKDLIESYLPAHYGAMRQLASALTRTEKSTLIKLLTKLRQGLLRCREQ